MGFFNLNCRGCGCGGGDSIFDSESGSDSVLVPDIDTEADMLIQVVSSSVVRKFYYFRQIYVTIVPREILLIVMVPNIFLMVDSNQNLPVYNHVHVVHHLLHLDLFDFDFVVPL